MPHLLCSVNTFSDYERPKPFPDHFELLATLLGLHRQFSDSIDNQLLVTSPDVRWSGLSRTNALLIDLLTTRSDMHIFDIELPFSISAEFHLCKCLHSFHASADPCNIWANAKCELALRKALELFVYQSEPREDPYQNPLAESQFSFGSYFIESCRAMGFFHDPAKIKMILRACTETILGINIRATHMIRVSKGGNSPQKKRGEDGAWRRDIDLKFHLHYWLTSDGPEFASVVQHDDFSIP